jgi:hypothetical protein
VRLRLGFPVRHGESIVFLSSPGKQPSNALGLIISAGLAGLLDDPSQVVGVARLDEQRKDARHLVAELPVGTVDDCRDQAGTSMDGRSDFAVIVNAAVPAIDGPNRPKVLSARGQPALDQ